MADLTVEDYRRAAKQALAGGDTDAANELIAAGQALEAENQPSEVVNTPQPQNTNAEPDTSVLAAIRQGVDQSGAMIGKGIQSGGELASNMGATDVGEYLQTSGREMAERNEAEIAASNYQRPEGADGIIKNLKEGEYKNAANSLLYGAAEAAPQVAGGIAASVGGSLALGSAPIVGSALAAGGTIYGTVNALGQMRDEKEIQNMDPSANATDLTSAIASGLVELLPIKGGGATLRVVRETIQEGLQEGLVIGNTTVQGGEYVPEDVVNRIGDAAITGGALSKGVNTAITTLNKTGEIVLGNRKDLDPEVDQAAGEVARLLQDIEKSEGMNLKRIDTTTEGAGNKAKKGANQALEEARSRLREEVKNNSALLRKELELRNEPVEILTKLDEAVRQSNNKVSTVVSNENIQFIKDTFGNSKEGQALVNAFRKSNVVTELTNAGLKGGISQFTDQFNPMPSFGRAYNPSGSVAGNLNAGAAVLTGGQSLAFQIPAVIGGRTIDAITGRRSKVATFVRKNRKKAGFDAPSGQTVVGMAKARDALRKAQKDAENAKKQAASNRAKDAKDEQQAKIYADDFNRGSDPTPDSPRFAAHDRYRDVYKRLGLSPKVLAKDIDAEIFSTIDQLLSDLSKDPSPSSKRLAQDLIGYKMSMKSGRTVENLGSVIGAVATKVMENNGVTQGPVSTGGPNVTVAEPRPLTPRQEGTQSNRQLNDELVEAVNNSRVRADNKAKLLKALGELRMNLGSDPVAKAAEIVANAGVSKPLAKKYLNPYLERIVTQQAAARARGKKQSGKTTKEAPENPEGPDPRGTAQGGQGVGVTQGRPDGPVQGRPLLSPALVTDPPTKPTTAQVKNNLPEAKAIIEIGKKGTKYENGIQDWDSALEAAKILNQTVSIFSSNQAMARSSSSKIKRNTRGYYQTVGRGGGNVFGLKIGGTMGSVAAPRTEVQALTTLLHEIAHGITLKPIDGNYDPNFGTNRDVTKFNKLTGEQNDTTSNSFVSSAILPILSGPKYDQNHPVIQEVINLQQNVTVYQAKNNASGRMVRDFRNMSNKAKIKSHLEYTLSFNEFAVDPVWVYMFDPKMAKEIMPKTTKLIKKEFDNANNSKIRFYSHPVATVLAVVAAMTALGVASENEQEEPRGILSA